MKNQDNNFKRTLLQELTGFSYKDGEGNSVANDAEDDDDFEFVPINKTPEVTSPRVEEANFSYTPKNSEQLQDEDVATTTISRATIINGGIQTRENIVVEGIVNGDIISKGKVSIRGRVEGNVTGFDVDVSSEELNGDIVSEGKTVIHASTKLKGNLYTGRCTIVGTVEGNIVAKESIELLDNAVIYGDIKAAAITVAEGAVIYGMVTIGKTKPETVAF